MEATAEGNCYCSVGQAADARPWSLRRLRSIYPLGSPFTSEMWEMSLQASGPSPARTEG